MYADTIRTIGKLRVILEIDEAPEDPRRWSEPATGAVTLPMRGYSTAPEEGPLSDQWARLLRDAEYRDLDVIALFTRYVRVFHAGIVQQTSSHRGDPTVLFYLTRARADEDGIPADRMETTVTAERTEWESWAEGDVYVAQVQQLTTWTSERGEVREEWEYLDSCGGLIGRAYAEEFAVELLKGHLPTTRTVYVVTWAPVSVGGFEWRETEDEARDMVAELFPTDPSVRWFATEVPADLTGDALTAYLDAEGWSDRISVPTED